jgi:hypothetical protein
MQRKTRKFSVVGASTAAFSSALAALACLGCGAPNDSHDARLLQRAVVTNSVNTAAAAAATNTSTRDALEGRDQREARDPRASERSNGFVAAALGPQSDPASCR